ncbi:MAG: hypothetical protein HOE90_13985 [Bacteriovoracaceae bacterium]|jgi:hypothetical protein|nr:hypothetical protein [Bacteriovoracaceae bacterium]
MLARPPLYALIALAIFSTGSVLYSYRLYKTAINDGEKYKYISVAIVAVISSIIFLALIKRDLLT